MIVFFVSYVFWVDKFNGIKISFVTCTILLVGHCHLTTILAMFISTQRTWESNKNNHMSIQLLMTGIEMVTLVVKRP